MSIPENRIKEPMTVAKLIEHLKTLPQDAKVMAIGHFGEPHHYETRDFELRHISYAHQPGVIEVHQKSHDIGEYPD